MKSRLPEVVKQKRKKLPSKIRFSRCYLNAKFYNESFLLDDCDRLGKQLDLFAQNKSDKNKIDSLQEVKNKLEVSLSRGFEGLELSLKEERTLFALQALLTKAGFPDPAIIRVKQSDLYEAAYINKVKTNDRGQWKYPGWETGDIDDGLKSLAMRNHEFIIKSKPKKDKNGNELFDIGITFEPLIKVVYWYKNIENNQLIDFKYDINREKKYQLNCLEIKFNPICVKNITDYYRDIPADLYGQVKNFCKEKGWRVSKYDMLGVQWFFKHSSYYQEISDIKWALQLKLGYYIKTKQFSYIEKVISRITIIAHELKIITYYDRKQLTKAGQSKNIFHINKEKIKLKV